jgi:PAS domain S-box-containing protein
VLKQIITYISIFLFIALFVFGINYTKDKVFLFFAIEKSTNKLIVINKNFDLFISNNKRYENYDFIEKNIDNFNKIKKTINQENFLKDYNKGLEKSINKKITLSRKIKSYKAILNNSYRIINKLHKKGLSSELNKIFINSLLSNTVNYLSLEDELINIRNMRHRYQNKYDKYFLMHSQIIFEYHLKIIYTKKLIDNISLDKKLEDFVNHLKTYAKEEIKKAQITAFVLLVILFIFIIIYFKNVKTIKNANKRLSKFELTLQNSDIILMITDKNENITYVNKTFENVSKYTKDEVLGKKPSLLQSDMQDKDFFDNIKKIIYSGNKWFGQFINKNKFGEIYYEKAVITPSFDDKGNIEEYIYIKLDITKEIQIEQKLKDREKLLFEQSKLSAMGEMIGNIAHQWRQPLSVISAGSTGILLQNELKIIDNDFLVKTCQNISNNAQYLSDTIDDFKHFIKGDKNQEYFSLEDNMNKFLNLINPMIKDHNINVVIDFESNVQINSFANELNQCLINIVNNSIYILKDEKDERYKNIFISTKTINNSVEIIIKDSANGIPKEFMKKIFEPYFTTKHKSVGTGLGLSMTHNIINNSLKGSISVENLEYIYNDVKLKGAMFKVTLPLS